MSVTQRAVAIHGARLEQKTMGNARQTRQACSGRNLKPGPGPPEVSLIYNPGSKQNGDPQHLQHRLPRSGYGYHERRCRPLGGVHHEGTRPVKS